MQSYELMTICRCDEDAYQGAREAVKSEIAKVNGTVVKEEELGERLLAYQINKQNRGKYILFTLNLKPETVASISHNLQLNKSILRHMFVAIEK